MEWAGESSCHRALTPPEWQRGPGGKNPSEGPHRRRTDQGRMDGRGGGRKPTQVADGGKGGPMGSPRTAEPPGAERETAADNGRTGARPQQSYGADGARSKHGALARRRYDLLELEATEGGRANAGANGSEAGHGDTGDREGTEADDEGEGHENLQRALPKRGHNRGKEEARGSPKRSCMINACGRQGGEGGDPPPSSARPRRAGGAQGGTSEHSSAGPHRAARTRPKKGTPSPISARKPRTGRRGTGCAHPPHAYQGWRKGGNPPNGSDHPHHTARQRGRGETPWTRRRRGGHPPEQCALPEHGMQVRGGEDPPTQRRGGDTPREDAHALRAQPDTGDGR